MSVRRGGRRSKGPRKPTMVRVPIDLHAELEAARVAAGYDTMNDYIVDVLARSHGRTVTPPAPSQQAALPLIDKAHAAA